MAGFEVIVRPVVFPNIRPQPSRSLPPADDLTQGQAVFSGSSGQVIALNHSYSSSTSSSGGTETQRTYDVARIRPEGTDDAETRSGRSVSRAAEDDVYVDVEVLKRVRLIGKDGTTSVYHYTPIQESENVEIIETNKTRTTST